MHVWVFQTENSALDKLKARKMRASNKYHAFTELSCTVRIISSSFCHISKSHRPHVSSFDGIDYTLLSSPGYSSNVSIGRLFDHLILAFSLIRFLCFKSFQKPDLFLLVFHIDRMLFDFSSLVSST